MDTKNVLLNHTLEEYKKKYRNRKENLISISKKEVEDFDKKYKTNKGFLLEGRKWWLIGDTYYQIPKAPGYTWFRNLNAACQIGTCVLAAGVVAAAVTVPLVLMNQTVDKKEETSITIDGATYDKEASHIELHKESTIVLKQKGSEEIADIEYVKVGDKTLAESEYAFDKSEKKITIKAEAMTSTKIEIKVKTEEPKIIVTKDEWFDVSDVWFENFNKSKTEYIPSQIKFKYNGQEGDFENIVYENDDNNQRVAKIGLDYEKYGIKGFYVASSDINKSGYFYTKLKSHDVDGVKYTINKDEIIYTDTKAIKDEVYELRINKDGYITKEIDKTGELETDIESFEFIYTGSQKLFCNIDWATTKFDLLGDGQPKTLYEFAKISKKIEFVKNDDVTTGICVGEGKEGDLDPIYAKYDGENTTLKVWSKEKISFKDNDRTDSANGFFTNCQSLKTIDFSNIDTCRITNFKNAFSGCNLLDNADFNYFDTSSATNMMGMFAGTNFASLDLSSFDTSKVATMFQMFTNTINLESLDLSSFDTSKVVNMNAMFSVTIGNVSKLQTIYVSEKFNTDNVTNSRNMFALCNELVGGKGTTFDSSHIDKEYACIDDPENEKPGYFTDIKEKTCNIDWATNKVDGTNTLYDLAKTATSIEFLKSDSTDGTACGETADDKIYFSFNDSSLKVWSKYIIKFENNDRSGTGGISGFFANCNKMLSLKLNNISTSEVTDFSLTFYDCEVLETIEGLNNLDTKKAVSMDLMFYQCRKLKEIDLSSFVTTNVTTMSSMFESCETITTLNLSLFDTSNVTNMLQMFLNSHELETIYTSQLFSTSNLTPSTGDYYMFANCTNLKGGNGTVFDSEIIDKTRAKIDEGAGNPGYFTGVNHFCLTQYDNINKILTYGSKVSLDSKYGCDVFGSCDETGWLSCPASLSVKVNGEIVPINSVIDTNSVKLYYGNDSVAFTIEEDKISNDNPTMAWGGLRLCFTFKLLKSIDNVEFIINCQ